MEYFVLHFQLFLLIMIRMVAMMAIAPFYSSGAFPFKIRGALAFFITILIFPLIAQRGVVMPDHLGGYTLLIVQEVMIGLFIGFLVSVIFSAFQLAGQYFAVQIGFGINEVIDPLAQISIPLVGQLKNLIGLLVFLAINGHHFMIHAIFRSYELAPIMTLSGGMMNSMMRFLAHAFSGMFVVALKISLPVVATVFVVTVSLGILAKAAPQMNIFMLGFPFKIMVSFAVMLLTAPLIVRVMNVSLERSFHFITKVLLNWPS
ncbi:MAG: flagellar biosynthetic protein FliR [Spirochaetes bacterium]|nr:flagellar biosynthetic protein FliR [Spirochaetota bacterium]